MATISVYTTDRGTLLFVVGKLVDGAPAIGVTPNPGASTVNVVAEIRDTLELVGSLLIISEGGALHLAKVQSDNPVLIDSFEVDDIDASDFE